MPTQGIWALRPRAQLLLALFLPFLTRGGGRALAMAKPLNLSQSSATLFSPPRCCHLPVSWLQEEVPLGIGAQSHPAWGEVGRSVEGSAVLQESPKIQVPGNLLPPGPAEPAGCLLCCYSRRGCLGRSRCGQ